MIQLPQHPDLVISVPLPHADITEADLVKTKSEFQKEGLNISLRAEEVYPISTSWAEIAIFLAHAAADHYADKLFDALDRFLKKPIDHINLQLSKRQKTIYRSIPRNDRAEAIARLRKALEELESDKDGNPKA